MTTYNRKHDPNAVLQQIVDWKQTHGGNSPSIAELCELCGVPSKSNMWYILRLLADAGKIETHGVRGIVVLDGNP